MERGRQQRSLLDGDDRTVGVGAADAGEHGNVWFDVGMTPKAIGIVAAMPTPTTIRAATKARAVGASPHNTVGATRVA